MNLILSSHNRFIKEVKSLKNKKDRDEKELFFIEGSRFVEEALKENMAIEYTMVSEDFNSDYRNEEIMKNINKLSYDNYMIPEKLFKEISGTDTPQGILAVIAMKRKMLSDEKIQKGMYVVLENIKDPGNMGTIIRTADGAGFSGIIVTKGCVDIYNPKVLRATMGSVFHIPIYNCDKVDDAVKALKAENIKIFVSHLMAEDTIYNAGFEDSAALIIGSEADGVSPEAIVAADKLIKIPMVGKAESLNVAVAAGIMIFEAARQRDIISK